MEPYLGHNAYPMNASFFRRKKDSKKDSDSSLSSTEEIEVDPEEDQPAFDSSAMEELFRKEVEYWLDVNGRALFNLSSNQWLAKQKKAERGLNVVRK